MDDRSRNLEEALDVALACAGELARASGELTRAEHAHDLSGDKRRTYSRLRTARATLASAERHAERSRARVLALMGCAS